MNINRVMVIGRIVRDPELKALPSGTSVCSFSVATNESYMKNGEKKESTEFHNVVCFGKVAENTSTYMKKGSEICVEGKLQTRSWEKDGEKRYRTEILGQNIQFGSRTTPKTTEDETSQVEPAVEKSEGTDEEIPYPTDDIDPSDIPF